MKCSVTVRGVEENTNKKGGIRPQGLLVVDGCSAVTDVPACAAVPLATVIVMMIVYQAISQGGAQQKGAYGVPTSIAVRIQFPAPLAQVVLVSMIVCVRRVVSMVVLPDDLVACGVIVLERSVSWIGPRYCGGRTQQREQRRNNQGFVHACTPSIGACDSHSRACRLNRA